MSTATLKVDTQELPQSRIALTLEVPAENCKASYEKALLDLSRTVKLPGFRKGRVPKQVLIQQIGSTRIKASAIENLIDNAWKQALEIKSFTPLSEPELKEGFDKLLSDFSPEKKLILTLETDVPPKPKLKKTKGLKAEIEEIKFDVKQVDELLDQSRKQLATLVPIENRSAEMGDVSVVSFKGIYLDDKSEINGGSAEDMDIDLEKGRMIPGFIEGIIGMSVNDKKDIECEFPEDYSQEDCRGRKASFQVILKDLKVRELPKLDDDFAKQASDKETLTELKNELENKLKADTERKNKTNREESLIKVLANELDVEIPKSLLDLEVRNLLEDTASKFAQQGMDVKKMFTKDLVGKLMESSRPEAEENIRKQLSIQALAESENIKVEEKEIENKFKEVQKEFENQKNIDFDKLKEAISQELLKEKIINWLEENSEIIEKKPQQKNKPNSETKRKGKKDKIQVSKENSNSKTN